MVGLNIVGAALEMISLSAHYLCQPASFERLGFTGAFNVVMCRTFMENHAKVLIHQ